MNSDFDKNLTYFENNLNSDDIPTVFIHGVGLDSSMWNPQKSYFKNKNVIFYDLLNHGKSKKGFKQLKFEDFNNQLIQLIRYLDKKKFNLIGFSLGALIAQHFTAKYYNNINKLILIASVYDRNKEEKEKVEKRYKKSLEDQSIIDNSINRWFNQDYLIKNPIIYKYFFNILARNTKEDFLAAYKLFVQSDNYKLDFSNFNMPTLIMTGENDIGSTPKMSEKLKDQIYNSKIYIISESKHMAVFEKDDLVNKEISKFLY